MKALKIVHVRHLKIILLLFRPNETSKNEVNNKKDLFLSPRLLKNNLMKELLMFKNEKSLKGYNRSEGDNYFYDALSPFFLIFLLIN